MAWWAWLLLISFILLLLTGLILLLPLRIFVRYLRENKKDQISLRIKLGFSVLRLEILKRAADENFTWHLKVGRIRIPAAFLKKLASIIEKPGPAGCQAEKSRGNDLDILKAAGLLTVCRQARPLLKKVTLSHFDLELSWGWDDPALTGLAAGGCWAFGGILTGLLQELFSVTAKPRLRLVPLFRPAELRLHLEGEAGFSLFWFLKLRHVVKKIGGAGSGTSSH